MCPPCSGPHCNLRAWRHKVMASNGSQWGFIHLSYYIILCSTDRPGEHERTALSMHVAE